MTLIPLVLALLTVPGAEPVIVIPGKPAHAADGEYRAAKDTAERVAGMLAELGLRAETMDEATVGRGGLAGRRAAILPYNPGLGEQTTAALVRFVQEGGKLMICYTLPPRLGPALGFGEAKYARQEHPGQFAEIRFDAADVPGLPPAMRQASWNITTVKPAGHNARVIGRWYDDRGKPTGHAAMLLSDRGAFFSHILLADDRPGKLRMLSAVLGSLDPPLWKTMAQSAIRRAGRVGHFATLEELQSDLEKTAAKELAAGRAKIEEAKRLFADGVYDRCVASAAAAHQDLVDAYLRAQPSPPREARAVWNHSGTGAYPGDWDRSAKLLAENGFNMVLPNMLWGGLAHYPSDVLPRSGTFRQYGDQLQQCTDAAKKHGLEVHVWKVHFNLMGAPTEFVAKLRQAGRTQVTVRGEAADWLCPSHPENQKLEVESMLEVARKYPVAGLHFDYIRYPGRESCYCPGCRQRFEAHSDRRVSDWPAECHSGSRKDEYNDWRCRQITALVAAVHDGAKRLRPELKISAAVFGAWPDCRASVAQDWPAWVRAGYLDFVCPMDYANSDREFIRLVESQRKLIAGRIPLYPGIGAVASESTLSADRVAGQVHHARALGAGGFCIFDFNGGTARAIVPGIGLGIGRRPAVPPHRAAGSGAGAEGS